MDCVVAMRIGVGQEIAMVIDRARKAGKRNMKGYVVANVHVENPAAYEDYRLRTAEVIEQYKGRFLVRGGTVEVVEGDPGIGRLVLLEFPSVEDARRFYDSPEYQAILPDRLNNAKSTLFVVKGV